MRQKNTATCSVGLNLDEFTAIFAAFFESCKLKMAVTQKLKLHDYVPYGLVVTKSWLLAQGLSCHTLDNWVKSGQLTSVVYGVYQRPDTQLTWQGVVYSFQRMGSDLRPGGLTALIYQGLGHYLELVKHQTIHLYGKEHLPVWLNKLLHDVTFVRHNEAQLLGRHLQRELSIWAVRLAIRVLSLRGSKFVLTQNKVWKSVLPSRIWSKLGNWPGNRNPNNKY